MKLKVQIEEYDGYIAELNQDIAETDAKSSALATEITEVIKINKELDQRKSALNDEVLQFQKTCQTSTDYESKKSALIESVFKVTSVKAERS